MARKGTVLFKNKAAGIIEETDSGYSFTYFVEYLRNINSTPISITFPLNKDTYTSKTLFPFFDGLIPEGWMLQIVIHNWKIDMRDRMGLLLTVCKDCIGAVSIEAIDE